MTAENASPGLDIEKHHDDWMRGLPSEIRDQFAKAKVRSGMAAMPDSTPVDVDLAAVYLCTSPATLKRMRAEGTGPTYQQPKTNLGTTARNQKIVYLMGELKRWLQEQTTSSTMHAAELRGTMFTSLQDLATPEPFWVGKVKGVDAILGHVLASEPSISFSDSEAQIEWLDWATSMGLPWSHQQQRAVFETPFASALQSVHRRLEAGREATAILSVFPTESNNFRILRD